ncbi:MAG: AI-2E family transporter [Eubacterium sp.]|nr:AI-2E family transporter [Eubacterium sp.]
MDNRKQRIKEYLTGLLSNGGYIIGLVAICTFIIVAFIHLDVTISVIERFIGIIAPFILAFFFAYLIKPIVRQFEKLFNLIKKDKAMKCKSIISVIISYIIVIGLLTILIVYIFPQLRDSGKEVVKTVKSGYQYVMEHKDEMKMMVPFVDLEKIYEYAKGSLMQNGDVIAPYVYRFSSSIVVSIYNIFMGLVVSIYMVIDSEGLKKALKRIVYAIFPKGKEKAAWRTVKQCNHIFNGFLFGKALDSLIIGVICFIAMMVFRLPYPLLLSVIVGVTNMIPYFGPIIGAIPGALIYLFIDPKLTLIFLIMILILQQFDGLYLGPKILGDLTGIKPLWVIFGVVVGGAYFGGFGMFLGVPTVAVFMYLFDLLLNKKLRKKGIQSSEME